ncbi:MAG TPA: vgr related protein [Allosphingosinicella sp.]|nr:vgr related protein [Allosphingosinicella sp.]
MREARGLTEGEIALAGSIFGDAIDHSKVRIVSGRWWPFQPRNIVMAPDGNIYFPPDGAIRSMDFAAESLPLQGFLIHELTHVWQAQKAGRWYLPLMRHPFCRYRYRLVAGRPFRRYGIEQQAEIVRHAFLLRRGAELPGRRLEAYEALLPFN